MSTLVLIDGHAMLYRAYFAFPKHLTTPEGKIINAAYGFTRILLNVIAELQPTHLAASFDIGKTWRHDQYPEYKANREKMPDDLKDQEADVYQILSTMNIPVYQAQEYEADDVIGTLATLVSHQQLANTAIVTGDMDSLQLVHDGTINRSPVVVFKPGNGHTDSVTFNQAAVQAKYQLSPPQIIDLKALAGDSSDNVPGVKGIGKVTATKLLAAFGSVEAIYSAIDQQQSHPLLKGSTLTKLSQDRDMAFKSKHLVTICTDLELPFKLEDTILQDYNRDLTQILFTKLGFHSLIDKLPPSDPADPFFTSVQQALL